MSWAPGPYYEIPDPTDGVPNQRDTIRTAVNYDTPRPQAQVIPRPVYDASFNKGYQANEPFLSGRNRLSADNRVNMSGTDALGYGIGQSLSQAVRGAYRTDGRALLTNGLGGAALGIGGVAALNALRQAQGKEKLGWKSRLLAALAGAGAGGALTWQMRGGPPERTALARMNKASFAQPPLEKMREDITRAALSLDFNTRNNVVGALTRLSPYELTTLHRLVATTFGAGAGALVARWLIGKGLLPMAIGGTVGALFGHRLGGPPVNAFGRPTLESYR